MRHSNITPADVRAMAKKQEEKIKENIRKGICPMCEDKPYNPHLDPKVCLDCYNEEMDIGCSVGGCTRGHYGNYGGFPYCNIHLANTVHEAYERYLIDKSKLQDLQHTLALMEKSKDISAQELNKNPEKMTDGECEMVNKYFKILNLKRKVEAAKGEIRNTIESKDVFPEEYEVIG